MFNFQKEKLSFTLFPCCNMPYDAAITGYITDKLAHSKNSSKKHRIKNNMTEKEETGPV
jgi:hypothetical protein